MSGGRRNYLDSVQKLAVKALANGASRPSFGRVRWNIAGNCTQPVTVERYARPSPKHRNPDRVLAWVFKHAPGSAVTLDTRRRKPRGQGRFVNVLGPDHDGMPMTVEMETRCRRCEKCRAVRAAVWRYRAKAEYAFAQRTWFGTITLSPSAHLVALSQARRRLHAQGIDFDTLPLVEQFVLRHEAICPSLTRYLKRVRKASGARLRYLLVAEAHESWLPHYHMLVHEVAGSTSVKHAILRDQWHMGFTHWKLVNDPRAATYLCKYLSKSTIARVRASVRYGEGTPCGIASRLTK